MQQSDVEFKTVKFCTTQLQTAFTHLAGEVVHFLNNENFISDSVHEEVLDPRSVLKEEQKAWELVKGVRQRVKEDPGSYSTLVNELKRYEKRYQPILKQLEAEYAQQKNLAVSRGICGTSADLRRGL
jgi:hypothetical protein